MSKVLKRIILPLVLFFLAQVVPDFFNSWKSGQDIEAFQRQYLKMSEQLENRVDSLVELQINNDLNIHRDALFDLYRNHNISLFIVENEQLTFWNEDELSLDTRFFALEDGVHLLANGWYLKFSKKKDKKTFIGLVLIKANFVHQNRHLVNSFTPRFQFQTIQDINTSERGVPIVGQSGSPELYLQTNDLSSTVAYRALIYFILMALALYFFLIANWFKQKPDLRAWYKISVVLIFRIILYYFSPEYLEYIEFFRPNWYAINEWIPSFADYFLNALTMFYMATQLNHILKESSSKIASIATLVLIALSSVLAVKWMQASVLNSTFSFNLINFYELNVYSLLCIFSFMLYLLVPLILLDSWFRKKETLLKGFLILVPLISLFDIIVYDLIELRVVNYWIIFPLLTWALWQKKDAKAIFLIINLSFLAGLSSFLIFEKFEQREEQKRNIIVHRLAEEKDPIAEYLFQSVEQKIAEDQNVKLYLKQYWIQYEKLNQYLKDTYFSGYWNKYNIHFYPCFTGDSLLVENQYTLSCNDYYHDRIKYEADSTTSGSRLYQLQNLAGRVDYIAELPIEINDSQDVRLYVELSSSILNQFEGYPELLIDERSNLDYVDLAAYSYAVYQNKSLAFKSGKYNYPLVNKFGELTSGSISQNQTKDFEHLFYQKDKETTIVLSSEKGSFYDELTKVAYLMILFFLILILLSLIFEDFPLRIEFRWHDFSSRIQIFLVSSLMMAIILFGIGTLFYIQKQNHDKNYSNIAEKVRSVNIELENKIGGEEKLTDTLAPYVSELLVKFSNVFYSDINVFSKEGTLFASSRSEIYKKGLKSSRIHPLAYKALEIDDLGEWVQKEHIGQMEYLSAYIPLKNYRNKVLGYLNLPYFTKQGELEKEISAFFVSTINIYVAIFAISLFISVLLINQLSRPLYMIRQQLSKLKLGGHLELIQWKSRDEIGFLVKEYNRMVVELSESAERLAQSERESAWREMAKQVAHEIKNPLTPMKLSIQHLQMAYEQDAEDLDERVKRTAQTLIDQIEALTNIANEFSHFAKMPEGNYQIIDLIGIIQNAVELYSGHKDISIQFETSLEEALVKGDEDQLLRLFNNLLKNSLQAKTKDHDLELQLKLSKSDKDFTLDVIDNGVGIPEEQRSQIFEPNFTTKTGGTGLGLAMSKNILQSMGGEISLVPSLQGAHFKIIFPEVS